MKSHIKPVRLGKSKKTGSGFCKKNLGFMVIIFLIPVQHAFGFDVFFENNKTVEVSINYTGNVQIKTIVEIA